MFLEENNKEIKKTKEKIEEDLNNKPTDLRWPWPNPLGEYSQQRMNDNLRLLAKDALFVSLSLFLIFSWFEWRNPGNIENIVKPGILFFFSLFSWAIYKINQIKEKAIAQKKKIIAVAQYGFLISLALTTIGSLDFLFIQKITFLANIVNFLKANIFYTAGLAIFFGFFTFWLERDRIKKEVEDDEEKEKLEEEKRENEFPQKYPKINKIPVLRGIIKWGYKEGWQYSIGLIMVFFIFAGIRFYMFRFKGSYADEYFQIISGINLFENGELPKLVKYTENWQYNRGSHVSFLVGLFMFIFGKTIFVAKTVPITLGCLNFIMLSYISKSIINNKLLRITYLLLFSFLSWSIFNHFYIRGYVFTEFSLILLIFLNFKLIDYIKNNNLLKTIAVFFSTLLVFSINYYFSNDATKYIIPLAFFSQSIFLYFFLLSEKNNKIYILINLLKEKIKKFLFINPIIILIILIILNIPFFKSTISHLLYGKSNTTPNHINFNQFFFNLNLMFSILAILSLISLPFTKNSKAKLIFTTIFPLLFLHYISSEELQVIRGMMYIFPLFFLSSFLFLDQFSKIRPKTSTTITLIIILLSFIPTLKNQYNLVFNKGYPVIPNEIGYHEYSKRYALMKKMSENNITFIAEYNTQKQAFFDFKYNYKVDFLNTLDDHYNHFRDEKGTLRELYTNTEVISDFQYFKHLVEKNNSCILLENYSRNHFLGEEAYNYIVDNFSIVNEGIDYKIYCN